MGKLKYTKEECIEKLLELQEEIGWNNIITQKILYENKIYKTVITLWGNMSNMKDELNLPKSLDSFCKKYSDDELLAIIQKYEKENGFFPSCEYWDTHSSQFGLPSSRTYRKHFGSWYKVRELCGNSNYTYIVKSNGKYKNKYDDKKVLDNILDNYVSEHKKVPTIKELNNKYGIDLYHCICRNYNTYTNFIKQNGYQPRGHFIYTDEYLENAFMNFVNENNRVPTIRELRENSDLPGEKAYKLRFGSWGQACIHYGYKPNNRQPEYYLSNGEKCDSSYECMVSNWLIDNNINYERNILYKNLDKYNHYNGAMNCDYLIHYNNKDWYVEIVGMLWSKDYKPTTTETITYYEKLKKKEQILKNNHLNYKLIYANEFKYNSIADLFLFLKEEV